MSGPEILWSAARLALAAAALVLSLALAGSRIAAARQASRRRRGLEERPPPPPSREGSSSIAEALERTGSSVFARERAALKATALARDALALARGIDAQSARAALRSGGLDGLPGLRAYLERDYLARIPGPTGRAARRAERRDPAAARERFLDETERALDDIDSLRGARREGRKDHG